MSRNAFSKRLQALGIHTNREQKIFQYDINGNLLNIYKNKAEACKALNLSENSLGGKRYYSHNYIWISEFDNITVEKIIAQTTIKNTIAQQIEMYSPTGELINTFKNAKEAAEQTHLDVSGIKQAAMGKLNSSGGFYDEEHMEI